MKILFFKNDIYMNIANICTYHYAVIWVTVRFIAEMFSRAGVLSTEFDCSGSILQHRHTECSDVQRFSDFMRKEAAISSF